MNEDVFPIEHGGFANVMLVFRGVNGMEISMFIVKVVESTESEV